MSRIPSRERDSVPPIKTIIKKKQLASSRALIREDTSQAPPFPFPAITVGDFDSCPYPFCLGFPMEPRDWEGCSVELASFLVDRASADLASHRLTPLEQFSLNKKIARAVSLNKEFRDYAESSNQSKYIRACDSSNSAQILYLVCAAGAFRRDPHKWRNLFATSGLSGRASEEAWNRLFSAPTGLPIFARSDLAELAAGQLHIACDTGEPNPFSGQPWRADKASGHAKNFSERSDPSALICGGRGAFQLAGAVAADSAESPEFGGSLYSRAAKLDLTVAVRDSMGPRAKLRRVAENACSLEKINQFTRAGAQLNLLKNCESGLRSAAPGAQRWGVLSRS